MNNGIRITWEIEDHYTLGSHLAQQSTVFNVANMLLGVAEEFEEGTVSDMGYQIRNYFDEEGPRVIAFLEGVVSSYYTEEEN